MSKPPEPVWDLPRNMNRNITQDLVPWTPDQEQDQRPGSGGDEQPSPADQVRIWTTDRLRGLIGTLQPYVDGTFGEVSPRHGTLYLRAVAELNRLWNARYLPQAVEQEPDPEQEQARAAEASALVRARVLEQLEALRARSKG